MDAKLKAFLDDLFETHEDGHDFYSKELKEDLVKRIEEVVWSCVNGKLSYENIYDKEELKICKENVKFYEENEPAIIKYGVNQLIAELFKGITEEGI